MFAGYTPPTFRPRLSSDEYARLDAKIEADIERDSRDGKCGIDHDVSLRHFFKAQHAKSMGPDSILVDEVEVFGGRIDLLAIEPTHMAGVEIKADRDTLTRLPAQAKAFSAILDQVTLLTTRRHLLAFLCAERTFAAPIPPWWGITEAVEADDGLLRLRQIRACKNNPEVKAPDLLRLVWRPELAAQLEALGALKGLKSASKDRLRERMLEEMDTDAVRKFVRDTLRARTENPADVPELRAWNSSRVLRGARIER